eukprot:CAMPEP_0204612462 /NCGR_PEP_ID=MMETSP0717-20131115/544_1 /ASSEMBLY_ACC=CAM_ASM_000666 /TAXON_ID=230516 /ORGANISM="Chaetoceros curvisetus" /LENGTH=162 /DNA_ID=CAMNT_0051624555 /DNA_START=56 /DNA_END=544 /DNA_ORIENTATION=-
MIVHPVHSMQNATFDTAANPIRSIPGHGPFKRRAVVQATSAADAVKLSAKARFYKWCLEHEKRRASSDKFTLKRRHSYSLIRRSANNSTPASQRRPLSQPMLMFRATTPNSKTSTSSSSRVQKSRPTIVKKSIYKPSWGMSLDKKEQVDIKLGSKKHVCFQS